MHSNFQSAIYNAFKAPNAHLPAKFNSQKDVHFTKWKLTISLLHTLSDDSAADNFRNFVEEEEIAHHNVFNSILCLKDVFQIFQKVVCCVFVVCGKGLILMAGKKSGDYKTLLA